MNRGKTQIRSFFTADLFKSHALRGPSMKRYISLVLVILLLIPGCSAHASEITTTILLYMCGTDLQAQAVIDLYEMCSVDLPENINLVVLAGGASEWDDPDLEPYALNRFVIRNHRFEELETLEWASMGDAQTLYDFLDYGLSAYPADQNLLILWDHGLAGAAGICSDETADGDYLSMAELDAAIGTAISEREGFRFDMIGFDACLMGSYEAALAVAGYADYMAASPELESGLGWAYDVWLSSLAANPNISMEALGRVICDSYCATCQMYIPGDAVGMSLCDINALYPLNAAMEEMGASLFDALEAGRLAEISRLRQQMYAFGEFFDSSADMVDLAAFADAFAGFNPEAAADLQYAIEEVVVYESNSGMFDSHCGLSLFFPLALLEEAYAYLLDYDPFQLSPNYSRFLYEYTERMTSSDYVFSDANAAQMGRQEFQSESFLQSLLNLLADPQAAETDSDATVSPPPVIQAAPDTATTSPVQSMIDTILSWNEEASLPFPPEATQDNTLSSAAPGSDLPEGLFGFSLQLSPEDLRYLSYVEGMLFMEVDDGEDYFLIDLGYMRNAWVDWEGGMVYSLFDGTWPMMEDQLIAIYDQAKNECMRRSLIPAMVNGEDCYLVAVFEGPEADTGRVIGFSEGFDENGLPARGVTPLQEGDSIIPTYSLFYWDEYDEMQETVFEGDELIFGGELTVEYEYIAGLEDDEMQYLHCFCLNDIFGDYQLSDFVDFD